MKSKGVFEIPLSQVEVIQGLLPRIYNHTIEEKVEEYKEAMAEGQEFPPITVWDRGGHYWLIDGMHRLLASKRLGKDTIKAEVVELADELEARILAIEKNASHGIPLDKEEKRELARLLYADGVEIEKLRKLFRVSERTIYNWVEGVKRRAKEEELKRQALELKKQGLSTREIASKLGVDHSTIVKWYGGSGENLQKLQIVTTPLINPDGTPTEEGYKALSEFIEENEEELRGKPFNEAVKDQTLRDVLKFLHEAIKRDLKRFIDAPTYEKVKNYLITIYPYKDLSLRARKVYFEKALPLWEKMKKEHEERKRLEEIVIEKAKEILLDPEYQFSTWKNLRFELSRRGIHGKEELIDEILHQHADELLAVYKQIPEADDDSLTEEELREVAEQVKDEDKWAREYKAREETRQRLKAKRLRPVDSVVEKFVKRVEELLKEETTQIDWAKIEQIAKEIEEDTPEEVWEEIRKEYEKQTQEQKKAKEKEKEKKGTTPPPSIEEYYRKQLELLLLDMGIKIGWVKAFEIVDEIYEKVKEFSKKAVRGW